MAGPYRILRYGTVYGRILGEDTVQYGRNLKLRLRSIPRTTSLEGIATVATIQNRNQVCTEIVSQGLKDKAQWQRLNGKGLNAKAKKQRLNGK